MKQNQRTLAFVVTAALWAGAAGWTWKANQPPASSASTGQGLPLFESLEKGEVTPESLEVYSLDENGKLQDFIVRKKDGIWTIPSHNSYPAEAADRLARTTTALAKLTRQAVDSRSPADHEKRGLLDPLNPENNDPAAVGKRVVIKGPGDVKLADLIIGKSAGTPAEDSQRAVNDRRGQELFFVRAGDDNTVYRVPLQLDLSTRFSDWINPSLIDVGESEAMQVRIDNYSIEEEKDPLGRTLGLIRQQAEQFLFSRSDPFSPWELKGDGQKIDPAKERLNQARLMQLANQIASLEIRGVRPKFTYRGEQLITGDLKLNTSRTLTEDRDRFSQAILKLQSELSSRGFNLVPRDRSTQELDLVAENGEIELGMNDGLRFAFYFGRDIEGDETAIEIGTSSSEIADGPAAAAAPESGETPAADSSQPADAGAAAGKTPAEAKADPAPGDEKPANRYVMVRVVFDESLLPARPATPEAPVSPAKPENYVPAAPAPAAAEGQPPTDPPADSRDPAFVEYDTRLAEYEQAKMQFELAEVRFADELKSWEESVRKAKRKAKDLNERFGAWYYVVSGDNLKELQMKRADLVQPVNADPMSGGQPGDGPPSGTLPDVPDISFEDPSAPVPPTAAGSDGTPADGKAPESAAPATSEPADAPASGGQQTGSAEPATPAASGGAPAAKPAAGGDGGGGGTSGGAAASDPPATSNGGAAVEEPGSGG